MAKSLNSAYNQNVQIYKLINVHLTFNFYILMKLKIVIVNKKISISVHMVHIIYYI